MQLDDVDLLDLDRFVAQEHYDMFALLRREDPLYWHEEPDGPGFWNVVRYDDLVEVNRQAEIFSSEVGGISIADPIAIDVGLLLQRSIASLYSHLVTRPTGRAVRMAIEAQVAESSRTSLSLIDLSEVTVIDTQASSPVQRYTP